MNDNRFSSPSLEMSRSTKGYNEMNGSNGKSLERKSRSKKKLRNYSKEYLQKRNEPANEFNRQPRFCYPQGQQRLFTAISDPTVCAFPMSLNYSIDQISLPMVPVYALPHKVPYKPSVPSSHRQSTLRRHNQEQPNPDEYTSLPPGNIPDFESDHQRRFSDPGLVNSPLSDEESGSGDESDCLSGSESQIRLCQVIKDNKRLETELRETKMLLQELKMEVAESKQNRYTYEPGIIGDLVGEIRESMKIHQEAFFSRVQTQSSNIVNKSIAKECEDLKKKLIEVTSDRNSLLERLTRLEEQVKTIMIHNSVQQSNQEELIVLEREKLELRREVQEAVSARKDAETKYKNYEQLINEFRKKGPNGFVLEGKNGEKERESSRGSCSLGSNNNIWTEEMIPRRTTSPSSGNNISPSLLAAADDIIVKKN